MKTIGLLGGMSCESTSLYYQRLNELIRKRLGGLHSAKIIINSLDFALVAKLQSEGKWDELATLLIEAAQQLTRADVQLLALASNTVHCVADKIQAAVNIPLIHIAEATACAIQKNGLSCVGLLGTKFTMEGTFYKNILEDQFGISTLTPKQEDRDIVHRIIYDELCQGQIREASRLQLLEIVTRLTLEGAQGIILGCTELSLLLNPEILTTIPLFDTVDAHVSALVQASLDK